MSEFANLAEQVMEWCDTLGAISQTPGIVDRRYLTTEHRKANNAVAAWMQQAGMIIWEDAAGNQWGRYRSAVPGAKSLLMGSHLDTVPNGGKYDGMLGVLAPIAVIQYCNALGLRFPFHIDIVGFGDEEGTRFGSTLLGSRALTGEWHENWRLLTDELQHPLPQAMQAFGLNFDTVSQAKLDPSTIAGFLEVHIEQGPVLENKDLPVGWVTAISGAKRFSIEVHGQAGHAGTVPMTMRLDALSATSEMILAIESIATEHEVVATVGRIDSLPNAVNVIPGKVRFSLDIRSEQDTHRDIALALIEKSVNSIADRRGVDVNLRMTHNANAVHCDEAMSKVLGDAIAHCGYDVLGMPSGAGHDAMAIDAICPVSMLFVRCKGGVSHHPGESIKLTDVDATLAVIYRFIETFLPEN